MPRFDPEQIRAEVSWEEFLKKSSIEKTEHDRWRVYYGEQIFIVQYESFVMFPLPLSGISAFRVKRFSSPEAEKNWKESWEIHVRADLRSYPDEEALRVVWCHLGRTKGDDCYTLYEYDRLDKSRPEGAMGEPQEMANGIKRWKIRCNSVSSVVETYIYVAPNGQRRDVILTETIKGYKWEISTDYSRHNSLQAAEKKLLESLRTP